MGLWQNTTYIQDGASQRVADAVGTLLREERTQQAIAPPPSPLEKLGTDPLQAETWGVAIFPGAPGWTVVKTTPLELLGARAPGAQWMRLVELLRRLSAPGFQLNLYDSSCLVLIEANAQGRHLLSGYRPGTDLNPDPLQFNQERLTEDRIDVRFELLPFQQLVHDNIRDGYGGPSLDNDALIKQVARDVGGPNAYWCDNITSVEILLGRRQLPMPDGAVLYFG